MIVEYNRLYFLVTDENEFEYIARKLTKRLREPKHIKSANIYSLPKQFCRVLSVEEINKIKK